MKRYRAVLALAMLAAGSVRANNLRITNVTVSARDNSTAFVSFDISWENSWRHAVNHDAAWVFFKVQPEGETTWSHVTLEANQVLNPAGYSVGSGTDLDFIVPEDKLGLFVRRAAAGSGTLASTNVQAVWDFTANGLSKNAKVRIQAFGLEMVYVAEGAFWVGSGGSEANRLRAGDTVNDPFRVDAAWSGDAGSTDDARIVGDAANRLWAAGNISAGTLDNGYPTGYGSFYCMKYEITQGQYADFLNALSELHAGVHYPNQFNTYRHTITAVDGVYTSSAPDRACNYISWANGIAFAGWAGLRPMTELEFEKACRGPLDPVPDEYAWGTIADVQQTGYSGADGSGVETPLPANANVVHAAGATGQNQESQAAIHGPVRVGIFARPGSSREQAGASYWGIMELSGNLWEQVVSINSRTFTGLHGDGTLAANGTANVSGWPTSFIYRGGGAMHGRTLCRTSSRGQPYSIAHYLGNNVSMVVGFRAVRTAPAGIGP